MTQEEILEELTSMVRQNNDAAKASLAAANSHKDEYEALLKDIDNSSSKRMMELYKYVVEWAREAGRLQKEAEVFVATINLIQAQQREINLLAAGIIDDTPPFIKDNL